MPVPYADLLRTVGLAGQAEIWLDRFTRTCASVSLSRGPSDWGRVGIEMALHVLAYNLKRVMNIMGIVPLIAAMSAA